jgi:multidrug resistance protein
MGSTAKPPGILPILLVVTSVMMGAGMVAPVLSLYAASFGVSATLVGMLITAFGVARLVVDLPAGTISERYGRRPVIIAGPIIVAVAAIGAASAEDFWLVVAWRTLQGAGSAMYMTAAQAAVADIGTNANRGRLVALYQGAMLFGATLGPVVGGITASWYGYTAPFWTQAIICTVAAIVAAATFRETRKVAGSPGSKPHHPGLGEILALLTNRPFLLVSYVSFSTFFTRTAAHWLLIPLAAHDRFGLGADGIGAILAVTAIANLSVLPIAGWAVDRFGRKKLIVGSSALTVVGLVLFATAPTLVFFWPSAVIVGVAGGMLGPASGAYAADVSPEGRYGPAMGFMRMIGDFGFLIGPILVGQLIDHAGMDYRGGLVVNAAIVGSSGLLFLLWAHERRELQDDMVAAAAD